MKKDIKERLMESCQITISGCWEWKKSLASSGYGQIRWNGINTRANRASYIAFKGEIPTGMVVRHTCDNKLCINPDHLLIGTSQQNSTDMVERGRQAKGTKNGRCKLSEEQVDEILKSNMSLSSIAKAYGISKGHAHRIKNGAAWNSISKVSL